MKLTKQPLKEKLKAIGGGHLLNESTWANRKFGEPLPTMADYKKAKLNEAYEIEDVQDQEAAVFDVIIQFKKTFEKSEWKKNRKINSFIKKMIDLEAKLGNETLDLEFRDDI